MVFTLIVKVRRTTPLLHHVQNACAYACKYITKDLDYYELPLVKRYLDVRKELPARFVLFLIVFCPNIGNQSLLVVHFLTRLILRISASFC